MAIDDQASVQIQAIMMNIVLVQRRHTFLEFLIGDHFANILQNVLASFDWSFSLHSNALKMIIRVNIAHTLCQAT